MKIRTKILLTLVAGLWGSMLSVVNASKTQNSLQDEAEKATCLVVQLQTEGESVFFLGKNPQLMYFADSLAVVYDNQQLNFALKDIKNYHFDERVPAGIGQVEGQAIQQGYTSFSESLVVFTNYPAGNRINVFTVSGRKVATVVVDGSGNAQLDMSNQPAGVYIINTGKSAFKWLKK